MATKIPAPIDDQKFSIIGNLSIAEVGLFMIFLFLAPVLGFLLDLPFLLKIVAMACIMGQAMMLLLIKYESENMLYWIGQMVPYVLRRREFYTETSEGRITPEFAALDEALLKQRGANFTWKIETNDQGATVLHIYESPSVAATIRKELVKLEQNL